MELSENENMNFYIKIGYIYENIPVRRIVWELPLKMFHPTKCLIVKGLDPGHHRTLIV